MKKLFLFLIIVFAIYSMVNAQTQRPAFNRGVRTIQAWSQTVTWHKKIVSGSDSSYTKGETVPTINNAGDSLFSDIYFNYGRNNVEFDIKVDATANAFTVYIEVLTANAGNYAAQDIPDSLFSTNCWLKKGTGMAANIVSTDKDSITTIGATGTIQLWLGDAEWYKFLVISSPIASDINKLSAYLNRQER